MPVELDALEEWGVGQRLLDGVLAGADLRACMQAEVARGALPPGELARPPLARIGAIVEQVAEAARTLAGGAPGSLDVSVAAAGRADAGRNGDRRVRGHGPGGVLFAGQAARSAARLGPAAGADRRAAGAAVRVGGDRPGAARGARAPG